MFSGAGEAAPKEKKPKAPKPEGAAGGDDKAKKAAAAAAEAEEAKKPRLYLSDPKENVQAKPLRDGVDAARVTPPSATPRGEFNPKLFESSDE